GPAGRGPWKGVGFTGVSAPPTPVSLFSPCRSSGSTPAGSPPPGRPACLHRAGPVSSAPCDRRTPAGNAHRCHRWFFPPALEPQDSHLGVTKDSSDGGTRTKAREAIRIFKSPQFSHTGIMPDFLTPEIL